MKIEFYTKNGAKLDERALATTHVPRVGELIDAGQLLDLSEGQPEYFFVTKVVYQATEDDLLPVVTCRQWLQGNRLNELMERGWLPGWKGDLAHDDV